MANDSGNEQKMEEGYANETLISTELTRASIDPPAFSSGDMQSYDIVTSDGNANVAGVARNSMEHNAAISANQPTLPSGRVIDCKNTMQSYDQPIHGSLRRSTGPDKESNHDSTNATGVTCPSNSSTTQVAQEVSAMVIVDAVSVHEVSRRTTFGWVAGILAIASAIVVASVCGSGKCSASSDDPRITAAPTFNPPTMSPAATPVDIMVERVVSEFINDISYLETEIPVNGTSAESQALTWLIKNDNLFNSSVLLTLDSEADTVVSFRVRQRYSLLILWFQQMDDYGTVVNSWVTTNGWLDSSSECNWYGITCASVNLGATVGVQDVVTEIDFSNEDSLTGNNFVGSIPPDIALLTSLSVLNLKSNPVSGVLPDSIGRCSLLQTFNVYNGSMVGTLPSSIGMLTLLEYLDLSFNGFRGTVPTSTAQLLNLKEFSVYRNELKGSIPDFIGGWTSLTRFDVYGNHFTGTIPPSIGLLTKLIILDVGVNYELTGTLPSSIGNLVELVIIDVSVNSLNGTIPSSIGNWSQIMWAWFSGNRITGTVPFQICSYVDPSADYIFVDCEVLCDCCSYFENCSNR